MEVNEEIIEQYLKLNKFFYIHDIKFKVYGKKRGMNYSNIDFLAKDQKGTLYDIEVKFRSRYRLTKGSKDSKKWINNLVNQLKREERTERIKEYSNKKPIKVVISTYECFGRKKETREDIENMIKKSLKGFKVRFWYFDQIIEHLKKSVAPHGRYDSPILQMIRLLK